MRKVRITVGLTVYLGEIYPVSELARMIALKKAVWEIRGKDQLRSSAPADYLIPVHLITEPIWYIE